MFKRPKEKSVQPEGRDFSKNKIFEVLTLCGSNRLKKFLTVSEKLNFKNITYQENAPDLAQFWLKNAQIWCIYMIVNILKIQFL